MAAPRRVELEHYVLPVLFNHRIKVFRSQLPGRDTREAQRQRRWRVNFVRYPQHMFSVRMVTRVKYFVLCKGYLETVNGGQTREKVGPVWRRLRNVLFTVRIEATLELRRYNSGRYEYA